MNIKTITAFSLSFYLFIASSTACGMPGDIEDYGRGGTIGAAVGRFTGDYLFGKTVAATIGNNSGLLDGEGHRLKVIGSWYNEKGVYIATGLGALAGAYLVKITRDLFDRNDKEAQKRIGYALTAGAIVGGGYVLYKYTSN